MKRTICSLRLVGFLTLLSLVAMPFTSFAQPVPSPYGESIIREFWTHPSAVVKYTRKSLTTSIGGKYTWYPPKGRDIAYAMPKLPEGSVIFILLDDGSVYDMFYNYGWSDPQSRLTGSCQQGGTP